MKATSLKTAALLVGSIGLLAGNAMAQSSTTDVVGYYTLDLEQGFNLVGIQLHNSPDTTGTFTAELEDTAADFDAVLTDATATYLLEIESGDQKGAVAEIIGNTATTLTLETALGAGAAEYTIRRASTLNELFGDDLVGGTFLDGTQDVVWLPDGSGNYLTYAYNTSGDGEFRPTDAFFAAVAEPVSVFYPDGMFIQQASATPNSVTVTGDLKNVGTVVAANEGFNPVASSGPVGVTLGTAELESFLVGGTFLDGSQDIVWIATGPGTYLTYAYNTGAPAWRPTDGFFAGDSGATALSSGFFIQRAAGNGDTAGLANVPSFYDNL